jgi:6-phosphogluconolactonase/glucosamine-6-phosphate isomerase/deaminase
MRLIQIDEILGVNSEKEFKYFFQQHLGNCVGQMSWYQDGGESADIGLLGLGMNGHVGFHEPAISAEFYSGCVPLSSSTCENLEISQGSWGATYGVQAFTRCKSILLIVRGEAKRAILKSILDGSSKAPAAHLMSHSDLTILADFDT